MDLHKRQMEGVGRCHHCGHKPTWRDIPKGSKSPFEGWLEHWCYKSEFYLHGNWKEVIEEWDKHNK